MYNTRHFYNIFIHSIEDYHSSGDGRSHQAEARVNQPLSNPFPETTLDHLLYHKNRIDNIQWDLEDLIRNPDILPEDALQLKRRIDASNQQRTDTVEKMDDLFLEKYKQVTPLPDARLNTESIAWALDRLSILALKIYHMGIEAGRKDAGEAHQKKCREKLEVLHIQQHDLMLAIDELLEDIAAGRRIIKVYRQMKMYNDPALNPVLYNQKNK